MKLSSLLNPKLIKCGLAARTKEEALEEMLGVMAAGTPGVSVAELRAALAEREKLGPFSMAKGSAFPHARTEKVTDFRIAVGTAPRGLDFKAMAGISARSARRPPWAARSSRRRFRLRGRPPFSGGPDWRERAPRCAS